MKTMKTLMTMLSIGVSAVIYNSNAYAGDVMNVTPRGPEKKAIVSLRAPALEEATLFVTNMDGNVIHNEDIQSRTSYGKVYDFSNLENGIYTIISHSAYLTTIKEVKVDRDHIEVVSEEVEYKPVFLVKEDAISVNYFNQDADEISFSIESGNTVFYEHTEGRDIAFKKMLDTSQMPRGEYHATLKAGGRTYSQYFKID
jgi:hypothetical protein